MTDDLTTDFLPQNIVEGLAQARKTAHKKRSRLRVKVGGETYPVLKLSGNGFALDRKDAPHLRGLVDLYDGGRHLFRALIIAATEDGDEMSFDFKRGTSHHDAPPLDFVRDENAPLALLPRA
ncbi:hypothetical protein AQS8620_00367 [Aquimixticola soesokkakensis]|uniref:Uncharacterized protein n=1 Tax=Aquimixticola soesokkakensis TaxID=1519096 RepID=A0A1Y5RIS2_9RHOB|nr:hypothetical protein [Aquimixticola soesokkakensis]SLN17147.1 hypothetical protein AQS8620_00367 [Aquimixticola soesokkakensis]